MNIKMVASLFLAFVFFTGCTALRVKTKQDHSYNFKQVKTYQWVDPSEHLLNSKEIYLTDDVKRIFTSGFEKMGLYAVKKGEKADVKILCYIDIKSQAVPTVGDSYAPDSVVAQQSFDYSEDDFASTSYPSITGIFTVIVSDASSGKEVWKGVVRSTVDRSLPPEKLHKHIEDVVNTLLNHFPAMK
jgi:hypothetical protein